MVLPLPAPFASSGVVPASMAVLGPGQPAVGVLTPVQRAQLLADQEDAEVATRFGEQVARVVWLVAPIQRGGLAYVPLPGQPLAAADPRGSESLLAERKHERYTAGVYVACGSQPFEFCGVPEKTALPGALRSMALAINTPAPVVSRL